MSTGSNKRGLVRGNVPADSKQKSAKMPRVGGGLNRGGEAAPPTHVVPPSVYLNERDRAQALILEDDQMTCMGELGGYRMVRGSHGVHGGAYYWEVLILEPESDPENAHIRLGWSTRQGELNAPVGFDKWSYGYRDINGSKCHDGVRDDGYGEGYGPGDVIGCYLRLDLETGNNLMHFFRNGVDQGVAYAGDELRAGVYFPAVSLFNRAKVSANFGPSFIFEPQFDIRRGETGTMSSHPNPPNAVSEVQPMSPDQRKVHEEKILFLRNKIVKNHIHVEDPPIPPPASGPQ